MNWTLLQLCMKHDVGVLQIPCPEMTCLGFRRERPPGASIWDVLDTERGRECCRSLSNDLADRIQQYVQDEYRMLAVLGGNPRSPGCAVHNGPDGLVAGSGVFMKEFQRELRRRGIEVPFRGIRDNDAAMMQEDVSWLEGVLSRSEE
jgi:predicted secreted protein